MVGDPRLTVEQQKQFIVDDLIRNNGFPPFSEADAWNDGIQFTKYAPDGVQPRSSTYIKDAWVKIASISPVVLDKSENELFVNDSGKLRLAKSFSFVVPNESFSSDCRTDYAICGYDYSLRAFDNGAYLNNQNQLIAFFSVPVRSPMARNDFSAVLSVNSEYLIQHYAWVWHRVGRIWIRTCDYNMTEDRRDSLTVSDSKTAFYYGFAASQSVFVDSFSNGLIDAWLLVNSSEDFNQIRFSVDDSFLVLRSKQYQFAFDSAPYNALTPAFVSNSNRVQSKDLSIVSLENEVAPGNESFKIHFIVPADELNCVVEINSHFGSQVAENACFFNASQEPVLNLTVSNASNSSFMATAFFFDNSTLQPFVGKKIMFSYGNQNASVETDSSGVAQTVFSYSPGVKAVSAEFLTDFEVKSAKAFAVVPTLPPAFLTDLWYWIALAVILWLFYEFLKKWLT